MRPFPVAPTTAKGVADFRLDLVDDAKHGSLPIIAKALREQFGDFDPNAGKEIANHIEIGCMASRLWWVEEQMVDLLHDIAGDLPEETTLTLETLPEGLGLLVLEKPLGISSSIDSEEGTADALVMQWHPFIDSETLKQTLRVNIWVANPNMPNRSCCYIGCSEWTSFTALSTVTADSRDEFKFLVALFALVKSPGIAETSDLQPDRAARKRQQRAGIDPAATRVIRLRGSSPTQGDTVSGNTYRHRWLVRGHWRSQPYGPGRKYRRPVFIAPHVKGPEGAPLLTGEKVYAVTEQLTS